MFQPRLYLKTLTLVVKHTVPAFLSTERIEGRLQQRFENKCQPWKEAITPHRAHGHPNNQTLLFNLEAQSIPHTHLNRYILAVSCDTCRQNVSCHCYGKTKYCQVEKYWQDSAQTVFSTKIHFCFSQFFWFRRLRHARNQPDYGHCVSLVYYQGIPFTYPGSGPWVYGTCWPF